MLKSTVLSQENHLVTNPEAQPRQQVASTDDGVPEGVDLEAPLGLAGPEHPGVLVEAVQEAMIVVEAVCPQDQIRRGVLQVLPVKENFLIARVSGHRCIDDFKRALSFEKFSRSVNETAPVPGYGIPQADDSEQAPGFRNRNFAVPHRPAVEALPVRIQTVPQRVIIDHPVGCAQIRVRYLEKIVGKPCEGTCKAIPIDPVGDFGKGKEQEKQQHVDRHQKTPLAASSSLPALVPHT
jgi:hypothetical protein